MSFRSGSVFLNSLLENLLQVGRDLFDGLETVAGDEDIGPGVAGNGVVGGAAGDVGQAHVELRT